MTLGVLTHNEGYGECGTLCIISVLLLGPSSACMQNLSTWSTKDLVSHNFTWQYCAGHQHSNITLCAGCAPGRPYRLWFCLWRTSSLHVLCLSSMGFPTRLLKSTPQNVSVSHYITTASTQVSPGHSLNHHHEIPWWSFISPGTNTQHASPYRWSHQAPEVPTQVYVYTRMFSVDSQSTTCCWTFHAQFPEFFACWMISFRSSEVSWTDGLSLRHS